MAISTNGTVLARLAGGLYNTVMSNATYNEVAAASVDVNALANTLYARDFAKSTDLAVATTLLANLGLASQAGLDAWVAAQLTAAGAANKGAKIVSLLNDFAGLASDATWGTYATAFNTKVDSALAASQTTGSKVGVFATSGAVTGAEFELTTGVDRGADFVGTEVADSFIGGADTLSALDALDGGAGNDTLTLTSVAAVTQTATTYTVSNIETAEVVSGAAVSLSTTKWSGLTQLTAYSVGGSSITASDTTNITVSDSAFVTATDAGISVNGGNNVSLTLVANSATTDSDVAAEVAVGATTAPVGAVSLSLTGKYADGSDNALSNIAVTGGTTVNVTISAGLTAAQVAAQTTDATNNTVTQSAVSVTGKATTTAVTVTQNAAVTENDYVTGEIGQIGVIAGAVTITDKNSTSSTSAGTIATVTLNNYGDSTIDSSAIATVNLSGTGGTLSIERGDLAATPAATTLALNVSGATVGAITDNEAGSESDDGFVTINIASSGTKSTIADLVAADATTINVSGDALLTLTNNSGIAAVRTITVTNSAGAKFGSTAINAATVFTGGDGTDAVSLSSGLTKAITMGAGNDTVTYGGAVGTGGSVSAGDGEDTIVMSGAEADAADADTTFNTKYTGFEVLSIETTATETIDLDGINSVSKVTTIGANGLTVNNLDSGGTVTLTGPSTSMTIGVAGATVGASESLNLVLSNNSTDLDAFGSITAAGVETIAISMVDAGTTEASGDVETEATLETLTLVATSTKSLTVSGNNGLTLTNTGNTKITAFDASGVVGNTTNDTAANLAVTFVSANTTATATVSITGGDGNDTLTGAAAKDTIVGGAGADVISGLTGQDTLTGGAGADQFVFNAGDSYYDAFDTITDLQTIDSIVYGGDTIALAAKVTGTSSAAAISTAGVVTFTTIQDEAYTTLFSKVQFVNEVVSTAGNYALFDHDGSTFVFIDTDGAATASATTGIVVKLTGVALPSSAIVDDAYGSATTGLSGLGS